LKQAGTADAESLNNLFNGQVLEIIVPADDDKFHHPVREISLSYHFYLHLNKGFT
jgi:hypothetical protein